MPMIGWIILLAALGMILGSLFLLRDSANSMRLSDDKLKKIRQRQDELNTREQEEDDWKS
ncbi:DUF2897 family protein [Marinobacter zhejiangensis]|uniref:DUF2897 domain-containing protein n=1 Tax=Marinobacter zhejiangensis TaxID=488535 RepID=A0A1I4Q2N1_9GAMM|nr:DUF2897 family protein [Marinobacter zhejiangensis]SFM33910.1 Protein of unknown function [Marinobacter zhejiangensis]